MKLQHFIFAALLFTACNNEKKNDSGETKENTTPTNTSTNTTVIPADESKGGKLSFKVNDTLARTNKTTGGDTDDNIGIFTEKGEYLSFGLYGDVPQRPHRGWLEFSLKGFKFEPGTYSLSKDNWASFTRYETIDAGGAADFSANADPNYKGTEMSITFTSFEHDPESMNQRDYLASGTFSVKLQNKVYSPAERAKGTETIAITEGKFEKVRIAGGPKWQ